MAVGETAIVLTWTGPDRLCGALGKPCIMSAEADGSTVVVKWVSVPGADGHLAVLIDLADWSFHEHIEDLPADAASHTFEDAPAGEYCAAVLAFTGTPEEFENYSFDLRAVTVE